MVHTPKDWVISPPNPYRFEPNWWVHAAALAALALSAAPLWALALWAPGLAFAAPPLVGVAAMAVCLRARHSGRAAFVQTRLAQTIGAIPDPVVREAEAEAAWRLSPRTPLAGGWLFWVYAALGLCNAAALVGWVQMVLGLFEFSGSAVLAIGLLAGALYGLGFIWAGVGVIGAAVRAGGAAPETDDLAHARLLGDVRAGRARAEAMAIEAALLAAIGAGAAIVVAQALGVTLVDIVRAAWPPPADVRVLGVAAPAPNLRELEAPLWRAKMAVSALLSAVAAFLAVLVLRTPLVESLARLSGAMAQAQALRASGHVVAATAQESVALRTAAQLAPLRLILKVVRGFGLAALLAGLALGLGLLAPGLALAGGVVMAAAVLLMALERMRQALLAGRLNP